MTTITNADREAARILRGGLGVSEHPWGPIVAKWVARRRIQATKQGKAIGRREALEEAVRIIESGMFNSRGQAQPALVAKLRAMIGETK